MAPWAQGVRVPTANGGVEASSGVPVDTPEKAKPLHRLAEPRRWSRAPPPLPAARFPSAGIAAAPGVPVWRLALAVRAAVPGQVAREGEHLRPYDPVGIG